MIKIIALLSTLFINLYGAIFLLATGNKKFKNRYFLGFFFLNSFVLFIGHFLSFNDYWQTFRLLDFLFLAALLAFYPLYYLYIYSAFNFKIISTKWLYHFIPAIFIGVCMLVATVFSDWNEYEIYMSNNFYGTETINKTSQNLLHLYNGTRFFHLFQIVFYNVLSIRLLLSANKKMKNIFSNLDKFQLQHFYIVNISFLLLMSIPGFYVTLIGRAPLNDNSLLFFYVCCLFTLLYIILAIVGLRQVPVDIKLNSSFEILEPEELYQNDLIFIEKNLLDYFNDKKPWLDPNLNIMVVAKHIGTNRSYVSNIINEKIGCNFNQFVNKYRINEAKKLLKNSPNLSVLEISELSGFGSVNSFLRIFKIIENETPTQFKKKS